MSLKDLQDLTIHHDSLNIRLNNLTIDGVLLQPNGTQWIELICETTTSGLSPFVSYPDNAEFTFNENDIIFNVVGIANNLSPASGNIQIGTSLTNGGAIVDSIINASVGNWIAAQSSQVDTVMTASGKGLYLVANLSGGATVSKIRIIVNFWRRRTPL